MEEYIIDEKEAGKVLSSFIQIPTVSYTDESKIDYNQFEKFHVLLEEKFPMLHKNLDKIVINNYSLIYKWNGEYKDKKPVLLTAHMDVVAVEKESIEEWRYPPFSGALKEGYVWGRGALDTKVTLVSMLYAVEKMLEQGYQPSRDVYFGFGHDEEGNSTQGATYISKYFKEQGITFDYVMDEGGAVVNDLIPGLKKSVASVGIAEKGFVNVKVKVKTKGGHTSTPPKVTSVGEIAKVIRLVEKNPMKAKLTSATKTMFQSIGPEMSFAFKIIVANLWLFKPILVKVFSGTETGNAMMRTTIVPTVIEGSEAENSLAEKSSVIFNVRILPGETVEDVKKHFEKVLKNMSVKISLQLPENPSNVSPVDSNGYEMIQEVIEDTFGNVITAPYVVLGATDAKKYEEFSENVYRFAPYIIKQDDLSRMHGLNERISLDNVTNCTTFFMRLLNKL